MGREYPSTPEEAFAASVEGAYYSELLAAAEHQGRIGEFPAQDGVPVDTAWDTGVGDATAIWFFQRLGSKTRVVGYYQRDGEGLKHYVDEVRRMARERDWQLGETYWPHDGKVREWGTGRSRVEQFREYTGRMPWLVPRLAIDDGIAAVRLILPSCEFDAAACADGLKALKNYRKEWDDHRGVWRDKPRHDAASDGADAFRTFATRFREFVSTYKPKPKPQEKPVLMARADGSVQYVEPFNMLEYCERKHRRQQRGY